MSVGEAGWRLGITRRTYVGIEGVTSTLVFEVMSTPAVTATEDFPVGIVVFSWRGTLMGTSEVVANRAVSLARDGASTESAILDLRETWRVRSRVTPRYFAISAIRRVCMARDVSEDTKL